MVKFVLKDKAKLSKFAIILNIFKALNETICFIINKEYLHIQVMDKSHICLCECYIYYDWFNNEEEIKQGINGANAAMFLTNNQFIFSSGIFHTIVNSVNEDQTLVLELDKDSDVLKISIVYSQQNNKNIDKYYSIPLIEQENEIMTVPSTEYNVEFTIGAKTISDIFSQMAIFGQTIKILCDEDEMTISSSEAMNGEMKVNIKTDDFESFSIDEDLELDLDYSLTHIMKYCLTTKLVQDVQFSISTEAPMKIFYSLSDAKPVNEGAVPIAGAEQQTKSNIQFYIASKVQD